MWDGSQIRPTPFLDITPLVSCCGERGLLGVAFHPNYETNGYFFVDYTNTGGDTVVARYQVSSDSNIADPNSALTILTVDQPFANHNGAQLQFGPDGYLYIGMGDGGSAGDPGNRAQNLGDLLGKMLRINIDSGSPYSIPPDNPFVGTAGARGEIWAYGLRNPWRFSFDRLTGDVFISDPGQSTREEVDFQPAGVGGQNYGWRCYEGSLVFNSSPPCSGPLTFPILEYPTPDPNCAVIGGYRYRGTRSSSFQGTYFYGDYCSGRIWAANDSGGGWAKEEVLDTSLLISTFGEDEAGEIYLTHHTNGAIYRLIDPTVGDVSAPGGYWTVATDGGIFTFGDAGFYGSTGGMRLNQPIVGMAPTPSGDGYWLVAADGGIFTFGDAGFYGSTGGIRLNQPIVGMAATLSGNGYWLVATDGGIFTFGDAGFFGSTGDLRLNQPIVGMARTLSGNGYWLVATDGGIFTFGDAGFFGSTGDLRLNQPIVGMARTLSGNGYWLVATDGGIFTFGDAGFFRSTGGTRLNQPVVGMAPTDSGDGYWLVARDGGIFTFGDAPFKGSTGGARLNAPVVGMAGT